MGNETKKRLAMAAAFLMLATAGSRILGLIREILPGIYLGMGPEMGAFTQAIKVPNLVRTLLADTALSAAFIPVFSALLEKERRREAWQVAFTVTVAATIALGVVTVLGVVFSPAIIKAVSPGWVGEHPGSVEMAAHYMQIMFPIVLVTGLAGISMGILNSYNHFSTPALAPILWNVIIIIVIVAFANQYGFKAIAWGFMLATVAELLLQAPAVWRRRWRRGVGQLPADAPSPWRPAFRSPEFKQVGILLGPVVLTLGIVNFNSFIGTVVATLIPGMKEVAPAYIDKAFRLFQLPQGMFAIAIGTVLFPALSKHGAAGRMAEFRADVSLGIRQIIFITLPFAAFFSVLAEPTIRLIYEYGRVVGDEAAISGMSTALLFFSVGMAFVSVNTLLYRAFYSIQKSWVPLLMGAANLVVNAGLMLLLYKPMGVGGITLATSVVSIVNFFGLMVLLGPRIGGVDARRVAWSAGRSIIALLPLAGVAYGVWYGLDAALGQGSWQKAVSVLTAYLAGGGAYLLAAFALQMPELRDVVGLLRRRRQPRDTGEVVDTNRGE